MRLKVSIEFVALIISISSLVLSSFVAYSTHFRSAKLKMLVGKEISFFAAPEYVDQTINWGSTGFYIPVTFHNSGPNGGAIEEVRIVLEHKGTPSNNYDMTWNSFVQLHPEKDLQWKQKSVAHPFVVSAKSAVSEVVLFVWEKHTNNALEILAGEYELKVFAWVARKSTKPKLTFTSNFRVSSEIAERYQHYMNKQSAQLISLPLGDSSRSNTIISRAQVKDLYQT
jgi:hypothetical protein